VRQSGNDPPSRWCPMIITRTPLRISIGGGGTDLPSYYEKHGGFVISAAISKYVFILINRTFRSGFHVKYSQIETVDEIDEIVHPLVREALKMHTPPNGVEVVSVADVSAGTGLGSSGTFTVGLLHALHALGRDPVTAETLAREAVELEMIRLAEPVGKQDQYIAAYGGLTCQEYHPDGSVTVTPLDVSRSTLSDLEDGLMLFFTGTSRSASVLLAEQKTRSDVNDEAIIRNLHSIKDLGYRIRAALERGEPSEFGRLMHEHWELKRRRSVGMSDSAIDEAYDHARANGAIGGKLVGAGGGGFLLFYTQDRIRLRKAMQSIGLEELRFSFDFDGSIVLVRN
jgi:D-glycero-alpha-D-manno-heptose-7-phosphate kinase